MLGRSDARHPALFPDATREAWCVESFQGIGREIQT
jgi:hypothetical protein